MSSWAFPLLARERNRDERRIFIGIKDYQHDIYAVLLADGRTGSLVCVQLPEHVAMAIQVVRVVGGLCLHDILAYLPDTFISEIPRLESYRIRYQGAKGGALRDFHPLLFWLLLFPEFRSCSPCDRWNRGRGDCGTCVVRLD